MLKGKTVNRKIVMKLKLLMACTALAVVSGCATYVGGTADEDGVVYGADGTVYDADTGAIVRVEPDRASAYPRYWYSPGRMVMPVYKQGSPNGQDMGSTRPEFEWYYNP